MKIETVECTRTHTCIPMHCRIHTCTYQYIATYTHTRTRTRTQAGNARQQFVTRRAGQRRCATRPEGEEVRARVDRLVRESINGIVLV